MSRDRRSPAAILGAPSCGWGKFAVYVALCCATVLLMPWMY